MSDKRFKLKDVGINNLQEAMEYIEKQGSQLRYLDLEGLDSDLDGEMLKKIVSGCPNLEQLFISDLQKITNPEDFLCLNALTELRTLFLKKIETETFPSLDKLVKLYNLNLEFNHITHLPSLDPFGELQYLDIKSSSLKEFPSLDKLVNLKMLYIDCDRLKHLSSLKQLNHLQSLKIFASRLKSLPILDQLSNLQYLNVKGDFSHLLYQEELLKLPKLKSYYFNEFYYPNLVFKCKECYIFTIPNAIEYIEKNGKYLKSLDLNGLNKEIDGETLKKAVAYCPNLEYLLIDRIIANADELSYLNALPELKILDIKEIQIDEFPPLEKLIKLEELRVGVNSIEKFPSLDHFSALEILEIKSKTLTELPLLDQLLKLNKLIVHCDRLTQLPVLNHLSNLKELEIHSSSLTMLPALDLLLNLEKLDVLGESITDYPREQLLALPKLTHCMINGQERDGSEPIEQA